MKALIAILAVFATQTAWAGGKTAITADFQVTGRCEGQFWIDEGNGNGHWESKMYDSQVPDGGPTVAIAGYGKVMISTGLSTDGAGGCGLFKAMLDCQSGRGQFFIDDGKSLIYQIPESVVGFTCR